MIGVVWMALTACLNIACMSWQISSLDLQPFDRGRSKIANFESVFFVRFLAGKKPEKDTLQKPKSDRKIASMSSKRWFNMSY